MHKPLDTNATLTPKRRLPKFRTLLILVACAILADAAFFSFAPYSLIYPAPSTKDAPTADTCAILFNSINEETTRRVNHGIDLFQQGKVQHLIMVGGFKPEWDFTGSSRMAEYAQKEGIPQSAIFTDKGSHDSMTNLDNIQAIMAANQWQSLILVSSPYHLARINRIGLGPLAKDCTLSPYNPFSSKPAVTRFEAWGSVHQNLIAEMLWRMMPADFYGDFVTWVRTYTCF